MTNHLWESTLFAAAIAALTLVFRKNAAHVRHWLWLAASIKFLLPFSLLVSLGGQVHWRTETPAGSNVVRIVSQHFEAPEVYLATPPSPSIPWASVWLSGCGVVLLIWRVRWRRVHAAVQQASPLWWSTGIEAKSSRGVLEPGVFGILRPVLLLPEGITTRLTPAQLDAIVAHEMCHVRRRDNLAAAIHMLVEAVFWFHPLVWWIGARLVEERERACDEEVLRMGKEPEVYAAGILEVCRFYVSSPLECVSGVTGSDLKRRIEQIMEHRSTRALSFGRMLLLAAAGSAALVGPVAIGIVNAPPSLAQAPPSPALAFEVASVKPNKSGATRGPSTILPGGRFTATNNTLRALILNAYGIFTSEELLSGGPAWIDSERYDVEAKAEASAIPPGTPDKVLWEKTRLMLRTLLADRFHLIVRRETREVPIYELVVAKNGVKLKKSEVECEGKTLFCHGFSGGPRGLSGTAVDMDDLALMLSRYAGRPVSDRSGVQGLFDIKLQWNPFVGRPRPAEDEARLPGAERREGGAADLDSLPALPVALEQQLGLRLESRKGPVEFYVIEHVEKPTEN
jgi:bla regulator protein blaR1